MNQRDNALLTQVGPGTPMGELLRWYWHPIATTTQLRDEPVLPIRILGEDLVLFQDHQGQLGLVDQRCPHRGVNLACGMADSNGLRCPYHGWLFSRSGECLERPFEDEAKGLKQRVQPSLRIKSYQVEDIGGLIFAWLGQTPAPLCPDWDLIRRTDIHREVRIGKTPCNWFQIMENAVDPVHHEWLHGHFARYIIERQSGSQDVSLRGLRDWGHRAIDFRPFPYGINKCRLVEGEKKDSAQWTVGHPIIFPNIVWFQRKVFWRVPIDDENTLNVSLTHRSLLESEAYEDFPQYTADTSPELFTDCGTVMWKNAGTTGRQDEIAWVAQGQIADRSKEHLSSSDKGIHLLRRLFIEQIQEVNTKRKPMNVFWNAGEVDPVLIRCAPTLQDSLPLR